MTFPWKDTQNSFFFFYNIFKSWTILPEKALWWVKSTKRRLTCKVKLIFLWIKIFPRILVLLKYSKNSLSLLFKKALTLPPIDSINIDFERYTSRKFCVLCTYLTVFVGSSQQKRGVPHQSAAAVLWLRAQLPNQCPFSSVSICELLYHSKWASAELINYLFYSAALQMREAKTMENKNNCLWPPENFINMGLMNWKTFLRIMFLLPVQCVPLMIGSEKMMEFVTLVKWCSSYNIFRLTTSEFHERRINQCYFDPVLASTKCNYQLIYAHISLRYSKSSTLSHFIITYHHFLEQKFCRILMWKILDEETKQMARVGDRYLELFMNITWLWYICK